VSTRIGTFVALLAFGAVGCGPSEVGKTKPDAATSAASSGDLEKIKEALAKAGIKNPPAAVFDQDDKSWNVVITPDGVGPNGEPPPGRPIPQRVLVGKVDYRVTMMDDPNKPRLNKTREAPE